MTRALIALTTLVVGVPICSAQSLGDVARKEAERRGTAPPPGKVYTNDNLTPDFTKAEPPRAAEAKQEGAEAKPKEAGETPVDNVAANPEEAAKWGVTPLDQQEPGPKDDLNEAFWRDRAALIRSRMADQNAHVEQLRQQLAALQRQNGGERQVVEQAFQKAQTTQRYLNDEWLRFERQARDRKVPEHWIR